MQVPVAMALFSALLLSRPSYAEAVIELSRPALRQLLDRGTAEDPRRAMATAQAEVRGEILDIRAFQGKALYYRVLLKKPDGQVVSIVINAGTGSLLAPSSAIASDVNATARQTGGAATGATEVAASIAGENSGGNGKSGGKGNAGSNGNSGNNGKSGGNGNGHGK